MRRSRAAATRTEIGLRRSSAAIFTVQPSQAPQLLDVVEITPDWTSPTQINGGSAALVDGPWYDVYGSRSTGNRYEFGRELYVARTPAARPDDRAQCPRRLSWTRVS